MALLIDTPINTALGLLRRMEWSGNYSYYLERGSREVPSHCPFCANEEPQGHTENCELWRFLQLFDPKEE